VRRRDCGDKRSSIRLDTSGTDVGKRVTKIGDSRCGDGEKMMEQRGEDGHQGH
jgi:hypothetical protein